MSYELRHKHAYVNNRKKLRKYSQGWDHEVAWQDGTTDFLPIEDLKKSNPAEIAEHVSARKIYKEVAFSRGIPCVIKKREVIISQVTSRIRKTRYKYEIEVPTSLKHAADIYSRNKRTFWRDTIAKETNSIVVEFDALESGKVSPTGHKRTSGHAMFYANMD